MFDGAGGVVRRRAARRRRAFHAFQVERSVAPRGGEASGGEAAARLDRPDGAAQNPPLFGQPKIWIHKGEVAQLVRAWHS